MQIKIYELNANLQGEKGLDYVIIWAEDGLH